MRTAGGAVAEPRLTGAEQAALVAAVRTNCGIADARHAADLTLCSYLLQMREYHRWERGLPFGAALDRAQVGAWIAEREAWWAEIEERDFEPLPLGRQDRADPFDVDAINHRLRPAGLFYGAGLLGVERPVFFLAELHGEERREGIPVVFSGRELARGLIAPPAFSAGGDGGPSPAAAIVVRRESLARWCWEKFEAFGLRRREGSAFHEVVRAYGLDRDFAAALPRWLDEQSETMVLHELGEHRAGKRLGPDWAAMLLALPTRRAQLHARAVRDHLADLEVTLPTLLDRCADAAIHFWFSTYDGVRETLFPRLDAAYEEWRRGDGGRALRRATASGAAHFQRLADELLARVRSEGAQSGASIERLLVSPDAVCSA